MEPPGLVARGSAAVKWPAVYFTDYFDGWT